MIDPASSPTISVVMPTLNQRRFIAESVRSVLDQAAVAVELVVMDGGSTDGTQGELARLADAAGGRLHWQSSADSGPAQAVNRAVARARAPLIGWLNSDDLYEPGALGRALTHWAAHPERVMVYGQALHVDERGEPLSRYPTLGPDTPLAAFAEGCFICQPSAFVRREAWQALGGLDERLRTAFDFDLWLRLFKAYPGRIGFVDTTQARSRLHAASITLTLRRSVALEGLAVLHRHLGVAPPAWLMTHVEERCAGHPFDGPSVNLASDLLALVDEAGAWLSVESAMQLRRRLADDRRLQLATPELFVGVSADGWAGPHLALRLQQGEVPWSAVELRCHRGPSTGTALRITMDLPDGGHHTLLVRHQGAFTLMLPTSGVPSGARAVIDIRTEGGFVPADCEPGSTDRRTLAFRVLACRLVRPPTAS